MKKSNKVLDIEKIEEDPRGCVYSGDFNGKEFKIFSFKKDAPRGGHYHNIETTHFILYGSLELVTKSKDEDKEDIKIVEAGEVVIVKPWRIHIFIAKEDSLILELREKEFETFEYQPYRKIVNVFIEKAKKVT